jgi:site-specific recombinase XerD
MENSPKNGEERNIPLTSPGIAERICKCHDDHKVVGIDRDSDPLFPNPDGKVRTSWGALKAALRRCARKAGCEHARTWIHSTRHSYITHLVRVGIPSARIADIVGHSTAMVERYSHLCIKDRAEAMLEAAKAP